MHDWAWIVFAASALFGLVITALLGTASPIGQALGWLDGLTVWALCTLSALFSIGLFVGFIRFVVSMFP